MNNKRVLWIDCAKGIGILSVILGHTVLSIGPDYDKMIRGIIFSFHMPLFFILSAAVVGTSRNEAEFLKKAERSFQHLILPALYIYVLRLLIYIIPNIKSIEWDKFLAEKINILVYSSGSPVNMSDITIPAFGMMWFFVVLFFARTLFDYICLKTKTTTIIVLMCVFCTIIGVVISSIQWLPFSLDIVLAIMVFLCFGFFLKKYDVRKNNILLACIAFIIWVTSFLFTYFKYNDYMELSARRYPIFPICYITAIAGTMFVICFCSLISDYKIINATLNYIGKNSLYLFCVHAMDYLYISLWDRTQNHVINGMIRIIIDIIVSILLIQCIRLFQALSKKQ